MFEADMTWHLRGYSYPDIESTLVEFKVVPVGVGCSPVR